MLSRFPGITILAAALIAAAPAPKPVVTVAGIATAAKLDATVRSAIAKNVAGLNACLEKIVVLHHTYLSADSTHKAQVQHDMADIHARCKAMFDAIVTQLDPDQQTAFFTYVHAQLKAVGIDMTQLDHGGMMMPHDGQDHDAMHGAGHGA